LKDFVPTRNRKVVGSNPTSGSICAGAAQTDWLAASC
jgi:hypothetical protein